LHVARQFAPPTPPQVVADAVHLQALVALVVEERQRVPVAGRVARTERQQVGDGGAQQRRRLGMRIGDDGAQGRLGQRRACQFLRQQRRQGLAECAVAQHRRAHECCQHRLGLQLPLDIIAQRLPHGVGVRRIGCRGIGGRGIDGRGIDGARGGGEGRSHAPDYTARRRGWAAATVRARAGRRGRLKSGARSGKIRAFPHHFPHHGAQAS